MSLARVAISILALVGLLWSAPSSAATVAIVRPLSPPPLMTETLGRLKGELTSLGFSTEFVDEPAASAAGGAHSSRAWLEQLAARRGFDAVVAIWGQASPDFVEVWVVDKVTAKSVVRTVYLGPAKQRTPEILSVRAIELLRSSLLEIEWPGGEQPRRGSGPPAAVVRFLERERLRRRPERWGVELGGLAIMSLDGVGPAFLPAVSFDRSLSPQFVAQLTLAGLGTRPTVENEEGSAQISQSYAVVGACATLGDFRLIRPFVALSAGALHTAVDGRTQSPANQAHRLDQWSLLLDGGVGAWIRLRERLFLSLGLHGQMAQPRPTIRFVDEVVARSAGPNLLGHLAVGAWL